MKFYIVDCFAEEKYQGNELLVVIADRFISDREQQQIAREINFPRLRLSYPANRKTGDTTSASGRRQWVRSPLPAIPHWGPPLLFTII